MIDDVAQYQVEPDAPCGRCTQRGDHVLIWNEIRSSDCRALASLVDLPDEQCFKSLHRIFGTARQQLQDGATFGFWRLDRAWWRDPRFQEPVAEEHCFHRGDNGPSATRHELAIGYTGPEVLRHDVLR